MAHGNSIGSMDELIWLPVAANQDGVTYLMNSVYPAIDVPAEFVTYNAAALTTVNVSGAATVNDTVASSIHRFETEAEAALQLQGGFTYPVIDDNASDLDYFFPFEDVPGSTTFDNIASTTDEGICSGTQCPTGGVRGIIQRAAYFDGVDDYLQLGANTRETISVWVNAETRHHYRCHQHRLRERDRIRCR